MNLQLYALVHSNTNPRRTNKKQLTFRTLIIFPYFNSIFRQHKLFFCTLQYFNLLNISVIPKDYKFLTIYAFVYSHKFCFSLFPKMFYMNDTIFIERFTIFITPCCKYQYTQYIYVPITHNPRLVRFPHYLSLPYMGAKYVVLRFDPYALFISCILPTLGHLVC